MLKTKRKLTKVPVDGVEGDVFIRAALYRQVRDWMQSETGDSDSLKECVVDESGKPLLKDRDIAELPVDVFNALVDAVLVANGLKKPASKNA